MKLIDLNLLLYAVNADSAQHARARNWLETVFSGNEPVGLPWAVLLGFLRIATHPRILTKPLAPIQAMEIVDGCELCSTDGDFHRFPAIRWINPLAE